MPDLDPEDSLFPNTDRMLNIGHHVVNSTGTSFSTLKLVLATAALITFRA